MNPTLIRATAPHDEVLALAQLPHVSFADGYEGEVAASGISASEAAKAIFGAPPRYARALMALRDGVVKPFGLKRPTRVQGRGSSARTVGMFPVLFDTGDTIMLGMDDKHLDFRICIRVQRAGAATRISMSTLVATRNLFGRLYLAGVMPFHRLLSRQMLRGGLERLGRRPVIDV